LRKSYPTKTTTLANITPKLQRCVIINITIILMYLITLHSQNNVANKYGCITTFKLKKLFKDFLQKKRLLANYLYILRY